MFADRLRFAMQELCINQNKVAELTGKSRGSISQYLSGKQEPSDNVKRMMAGALGLPMDYFFKENAESKGIMRKLSVVEASRLLGVHPETIRKGLKQGVFPWGYGIQTTENRWTFIINAEKFAKIEGITI